MSKTTLQTVADALLAIDANQLVGWGTTRIPNEVDDDIKNVIEGYLQLNDQEKTIIRNSIKPNQKFVFLAFAERMASLAIRLRSQDPLRLGMMAIFLQIGHGDVREDIITLTLIHASAKKLNSDPRAVFLDSAKEFGLSDTSGLQVYLSRSEEDKSLESMGFAEGADEDGFRFVCRW